MAEKKSSVAYHSLPHQFGAELLGTFILVFFGCGAVATAVLLKVQSGLWQVASIWGFAIALAIYATAAVSGAHINPAVTLAIAVFRKSEFPSRKIIPYFAAQLTGAFLAAALLYALFQGIIARFEATNELIRGRSGSQLSGMIFGEYFPNPAIFGVSKSAWSLVPVGTAFLAETVGTAFLCFFIFALVDKRNEKAPGFLTPFFIGFTVAILISILAPLTQAGLNPARDFGPRLFSYLAGWGKIALPGPRLDFWIYILAPFAGGLLGAFIYERLIGDHLK